jgi:hypothetical protein
MGKSRILVSREMETLVDIAAIISQAMFVVSAPPLLPAEETLLVFEWGNG